MALASKLSVASGDFLHNNSYPRIACHLTGPWRTSDMGPPVSRHVIGSSDLRVLNYLHGATCIFRHAQYKGNKVRST